MNFFLFFTYIFLTSFSILSFEQEDSKSEYFTNLQNELKMFNKNLEIHAFDEEFLLKKAIENIKSDEGHLKILGLKILKDYPVNKKILDTLINDILFFHDSKLIQPLFIELKRYIPEHEKFILESIFKSLNTGSFFIREEISKNADLFLTLENINQVENLAKKLPSNLRKNFLGHITNFRNFHKYIEK